MLFTIIGIVIIVGGVVATFVVSSLRVRQADASIAETAASLGLAPEGKAYSGVVDGVRVTLYESLGAARRNRDLFSFPSIRDPHPEGLAAAVTVAVQSAPAELAFGQKEPLIRHVQETGDPEFDRIFAVREAPPAAMSYLTEPRRQRFIARPTSWFADRLLLTRIGDPSADVMVERIRALVATALALDAGD